MIAGITIGCPTTLPEFSGRPKLLLVCKSQWVSSLSLPGYASFSPSLSPSHLYPAKRVDPTGSYCLALPFICVNHCLMKCKPYDRSGDSMEGSEDVNVAGDQLAQMSVDQKKESRSGGGHQRNHRTPSSSHRSASNISGN
ncbi:unnamed protein product, partial [Oppiella nova]